jgi:2-haloacid dehalogenase
MTKPLQEVKVCIFDAYGTLFDVAASARRCAYDIGDNWLDFSALWRKKQVEYTWLRTLMGEFKDFWHVTGDALDFTMETFNIYDPPLRAKLMELYLKLDTYPEVRPVLQSLRKSGIKTVMLSNGSRTMLTSAVRSGNLQGLLDDIYSADDVGVFKIDPRIYEVACDQLDIEPAQACFLSANSWDTVGASVFGFQVVWVNRFGQKQEKLGPKAVPQHTVKTLDQLLTLIGESDE